MRVLLLADALSEARVLAKDLARFRVRTLYTGSRQAALAAVDDVDAALVSLCPPCAHKLAACCAIRARSNVPIVALVGQPEVGERVLGLRTGIDDYMCKPVSAGSLIARLDGVRHRRTRQLQPSRTVYLDDMTIDLGKQTVTVAGDTLNLTRKEFQVLALLAEQIGGVCARQTLVNQIWGNPWDGADKTLTVYIAILRAKIGRPRLIETVRGVGYRLAHVPGRAVNVHAQHAGSASQQHADPWTSRGRIRDRPTPAA